MMMLVASDGGETNDNFVRSFGSGRDSNDDVSSLGSVRNNEMPVVTVS